VSISKGDFFFRASPHKFTHLPFRIDEKRNRISSYKLDDSLKFPHILNAGEAIEITLAFIGEKIPNLLESVKSNPEKKLTARINTSFGPKKTRFTAHSLTVDNINNCEQSNEEYFKSL
jgi:hypothetical protein